MTSILDNSWRNKRKNQRTRSRAELADAVQKLTGSPVGDVSNRLTLQILKQFGSEVDDHYRLLKDELQLPEMPSDTTPDSDDAKSILQAHGIAVAVLARSASTKGCSSEIKRVCNGMKGMNGGVDVARNLALSCGADEQALQSYEEKARSKKTNPSIAGYCKEIKVHNPGPAIEQQPAPIPPDASEWEVMLDAERAKSARLEQQNAELFEKLQVLERVNSKLASDVGALQKSTDALEVESEALRSELASLEDGCAKRIPDAPSAGTGGVRSKEASDVDEMVYHVAELFSSAIGLADDAEDAFEPSAAVLSSVAEFRSFVTDAYDKQLNRLAKRMTTTASKERLEEELGRPLFSAIGLILSLQSFIGMNNRLFAQVKDAITTMSIESQEQSAELLSQIDELRGALSKEQERASACRENFGRLKQDLKDDHTFWDATLLLIENIDAGCLRNKQADAARYKQLLELADTYRERQSRWDDAKWDRKK